ncbi:UNVERIFIED_CONTAM: hypothetical protein K2H54_064980, partial [Gekko kuhli]
SGHAGPNPPQNVPLFRPEDELEHLTKKMLYDMENPPSDEYFGMYSATASPVVSSGGGEPLRQLVRHEKGGGGKS